MDNASVPFRPGSIVSLVSAGRPASIDDCILIAREPRPSAVWLAEQHDQRCRDHADSQWWSAMPLTGGLLLVPEPLLRLSRVATREDILTAVDHANHATRRRIASLFPDIVAAIAASDPKA